MGFTLLRQESVGGGGISYAAPLTLPPLLPPPPQPRPPPPPPPNPPPPNPPPPPIDAHQVILVILSRFFPTGAPLIYFWHRHVVDVYDFWACFLFFINYSTIIFCTNKGNSIPFNSLKYVTFGGVRFPVSINELAVKTRL